jgi:uncharacterized membrane protein HdeD (DUF308 family)
MKRAKPQMLGAEHRLSSMDYYQIFTSVLMLVMGAVILFRSFTGSVTVPALLVGAGFLALSCYRLRFVIRYFEERRKWSHR